MTATRFDRATRQNWGYWDGRLAYDLGQCYRYTHFDNAYLAGWQAGYEARTEENLSKLSQRIE